MNIKQKAREMFDEKFGVGFLYENTPINKNKSAKKIKSFIDQIIDMAIAERDKDTESKLDEVWGILCDMDTNIKSEKEYAKDIINLIIHHQDR